MSRREYAKFIKSKSQLEGEHGFEPTYMPDFLFPFQQFLVNWAINKGRGAIFADCGLGKTLMEMTWAQNVHIKTGKPVMILTPLAVTSQFEKEAAKFGYELARSVAGEIKAPIIVTNYERLHMFNTDDFGGVVCDESSILKSFDGVRKSEITEFMRMQKYRLLGTATAAPNSFTEVGTSSEALGYLGYMDMLGRFFTNKERTSKARGGRWRAKSGEEWRFKGHAEDKFWQWMTGWSRALRKPSDVGFDDSEYQLPPLNVVNHLVNARQAAPGMLFNLPAIGFAEQRAERRRTISERCEMVADLVNPTGQSAVVWCELNDEGDTMERLIPDAIQVSGKDSDESKEEKFNAFSDGDARVLITKPKIGAWGLNWQHCNHMTWFPTHSYEQYYQATRRLYRFGQEKPVPVDIVATEGYAQIQTNLDKKVKAADEMFTQLVGHMNDSINLDRLEKYENQTELPTWL